MAAADRLMALDTLPAPELCARTEAALTAFAEAMNAETTLLRTGRYSEAEPAAAAKSLASEAYVTLARSVQRQHPRLKAECPEGLERLRRCHDKLATQMAENLRVLATARAVSETLLGDLAGVVGRAARPQTYGAGGVAAAVAAPAATGLALNRAL